MNKTCLTYVIKIIYDDKQEDFKIMAVFLICIPNGALYPVYKDDIIKAGKNKGKSFRYDYSKKPLFQLLNNKPKRIKVLYLDNSLRIDLEDLIGIRI